MVKGGGTSGEEGWARGGGQARRRGVHEGEVKRGEGVYTRGGSSGEKGCKWGEGQVGGGGVKKRRDKWGEGE